MVTNEDSKPSHNALVELVVYGKDGKSDPIILNKEKREEGCFEPGKMETFDVSRDCSNVILFGKCVNLALVYKLRSINPLKTSPEYTQAGVYGKCVL